jgi:hypothetical protein
MAELNFGLLTPPGSESIGNAFVRGQDQALAARQAENQNAMAQYALNKAQRDEAQQIELNNLARQPGFKFDIGTAIKFGAPGLAAYKAQSEGNKAAADTAYRQGQIKAQPGLIAKTEAEIAAANLTAHKTKQTFNNQAVRDLALNPSDENIIAYQQDAVLKGIYTPEEANRIAAGYLAIPIAERAAKFARAGAAPLAPQGQTVESRTMAELGFPLTHEGYAAFRASQQQPKLLTPEEEAQRVRIAQQGRPPVQPVAPTVTEVIDPKDPTKLLRVDARRYTGGSTGDPGVLGVSGKEPSAALRENKIETGKTLLTDELSNLRAALTKLNETRAIPSTDRGALSNVGSSVSASGLGQATGRVFGTEAQVERDVISSSKLRLVNAIKQATGMSAQQLNSNVELQTMLKSLSDPSQAIEANIRNLDNIQRTYIDHAPGATNTRPKTSPAPANRPSLDQIFKKPNG